MSTKHCPRCGSTHLATLRTLNQKRCACSPGTPIPWDLDPGQKPLGYARELTPGKLNATMANDITANEIEANENDTAGD